jgi:hypothetical protein
VLPVHVGDRARDADRLLEQRRVAVAGGVRQIAPQADRVPVVPVAAVVVVTAAGYGDARCGGCGEHRGQRGRGIGAFRARVPDVTANEVAEA